MDKQIDIILEDDGPRTFATVLTPLGQYVMRTVSQHYNTQTHWHLDDAECEALEVSAFAHKATLHRV